METKSGSKLMPYENIISNFKSPYDSIFMSKVGSNTKGKRKDDSPFTIGHERTNSNQEKKKVKTYLDMVNKSREEMLMAGGKKYASTNPR